MPFCNIAILHCWWSPCEMLLKDFNFSMTSEKCPALQPLTLLMNQLLHGILLWNLTTCLEQLFYRTLHNSCFCHLISFRTTLSMIHVKKSMQIYFSKIICGSRTKIYLYIMDLYLCVAESKVKFATNGKWRLKLGNCLLRILQRFDSLSF